MPSRTFVELVQQAYKEAGIGGAVPTTVLNQVGRSADMVRWVQKAWDKIQLLHSDWDFNWASGTFNLDNGVDEYDSVVDFGITAGIRDFVREGAYCYDSVPGINSRQWMQYLEWARFRTLVVPVTPGIPTAFTLTPNGKVRYWPRPDRTTIVAVHEYQMNPQELSADTDVPRAPAKFHDMIAWEAVMMQADRIKDAQRYDTAKGERDEYLDRMEQECRPKITFGGPLA